jgi:hypothetical protein
LGAVTFLQSDVLENNVMIVTRNSGAVLRYVNVLLRGEYLYFPWHSIDLLHQGADYGFQMLSVDTTPS